MSKNIDFEKYYDKQREDINDRIQEMLEETEGDKRMRNIIHEAIKGGKRFRPTLCMLSFDLHGDGDRKRALTHASIIEMAHEASLCQDDVIDMDEERRGRQSMWNRLLSNSLKGIGKALPEGFLGELNPTIWGKVMSDNILLGDGILAFGLKFVDDPKVIQVMSEGLYSLAEGAFLEADSFLKTKVFGTSEDKYIQIIKGKTASLFALSTQVGAISAGAKVKKRENARKLGLDLGICYQVADDLADGDVPKGVDAKKLLKEYANRYTERLEELPDNDYKEMFDYVLPYMVNKLMEEEDYEEAFVHVEDKGYKFADRDRVSFVDYVDA